MSQLDSEKRYLEKSNRHLENILEATNAYKKQEVSELNRIHVETIKVSESPRCEFRSVQGKHYFDGITLFRIHSVPCRLL